jgi:hypothetical protein
MLDLNSIRSPRRGIGETGIRKQWILGYFGVFTVCQFPIIILECKSDLASGIPMFLHGYVTYVSTDDIIIDRQYST